MLGRLLFVCGCAAAGFVPPLSGAPAQGAPSCSMGAAPERFDVIADRRAEVPKPLTDVGPRFPKLEVKSTHGLPNEYQLNQGKAIDSLRRDYPRLFTHEPDFSIFREDIELHDSSGIRIAGMAGYQRVFSILRWVGSTTMNKAEVTHRLVVTDDVIRIRWSAKLWMKGLNFGAGAEPALVHLDGVSAYELDGKGMIRLHRLENIVLTGRDQQAINLGFAWPAAETPVPVPARPFFRTLDAALAIAGGPATAAPAMLQPTLPRSARRTPPPRASGDAEPPAETPFERAARERAEDAAKEAERRAQMIPIFEEPKAKKGPFGLSLGALAPQSCESNFDCERPMVCCDLIVASVCCNSGLMVGKPDPSASLQGVPIPIPVERDEGGNQAGRPPPQYPGQAPW